MRNSSSTNGFFPQLRTRIPVAPAHANLAALVSEAHIHEIAYQFLVHPEKNSIYAAEQLSSAAPELQLPLQLYKNDAEKLIHLLLEQHGQQAPASVTMVARLQALDGVSWISCELKAHCLPGTYKDLLGWHVQAFQQKYSPQQQGERILFVLNQLFHAGLWQYDQKTETIVIDAGLQKLLMLERKYFSIQEWLAFIHPDDVKRLYKKVFNLQRKIGLFHLNVRFRVNVVHAYRYLTLSAAAFLEESGNTTIMGLCFDITHEQHLQSKHILNKTLLEEVQSLGNIGCFEWLPDIQTLSLTKPLRHILNLSKEETLTPAFLQSRLSAIDYTSLTGAFETLLAGEEHYQELTVEFRNQDSTTKRLWVHARAHFQEGCLTMLTGIVQDVTQQHFNQLYVKDRLFAGLLNNLPIAILGFDKYLNIISVHGNGLKKCGLSRRQLLGKSVLNVLPEFETPLRTVLADQAHSFITEHSKELKDFSLFNYYYFDEEQGRAVGFSLDISKQRQTEEAAIYLEQLEHRYQLMDTFVHAVAHDLRSPVVNLDMLLALLKEENTLDDQSRYIAAMASGVQHLKRTLDALIEILRIDKDSMVTAEDINFQELLQELELDYKEHLEQANGKLNIYMQCDSIRYNKAYLTSILRNLISNAIKYSYPNRPVRISICTERKGDLVILLVQDNGMGMDLKKWGHLLFKPFKRLNNHRAGTGIGLHLIKQIIEKNAGKIKVKSQPGQGTTFYCFLRPYN